MYFNKEDFIYNKLLLTRCRQTEKEEENTEASL